MLAVSGIAASVTHRQLGQACCSGSRCDGGRVRAAAPLAGLWLPPRRREGKGCAAAGADALAKANGVNAASSAAWKLMLAVASGLVAVQGALADADVEESIVGKDAVSAYARLTARRAVDADDFDLKLPELNLQLPELNFQLPELGLGGVTGFVSENPAAVIGGLLVLAVPLVVYQLLNRKPKPFGTVSAEDAYERLGDEALGGQLVDVRSFEDAQAEGAPDLRAYRKKVFQLPYVEGEEDEEVAAAFVDKLKSKFKKPEETTLYFLDRFDGSSLALAKLATENGFLGAYAVKGGAEGPNGWRSAELPWVVPRKPFKLPDFSGLKEVLDNTFGEETGAVVPATLGVAAAAAAGVLVFSEAETALQLLGSAALIQLVVKKFLFAKDREQTIQQIKELLDTKVAPTALVDDIQSIRNVIVSTAEEVTVQVVGGEREPPPSNGAVISEAPAQVTAEAEVVEEPAREEVPQAKKDEAPVPSDQVVAEASGPAPTEASDPTPTEASDPTPTEASEPARTEPSGPAPTKASKPAGSVQAASPAMFFDI